MNSPLALVLAGAGGLCLLVGGWYSTAKIREPESSQSAGLRLFGAACLVIAGQEYAALGVYRAVDLESYLGAVRWHAVFSLAAPVAIIWFVALYTDLAVRWFLWVYTGVTATVIVLNLASPNTMHFSYVIEVGGVALPWGERLTQATAIPSRWPPLADYLMVVFGGLCAYVLWKGSGPSGRRSRASLEAGLALLIATIAVELLDPRRVSALPVDEFGLLAFVIVLGMALRRSPASSIIPGAGEAGDVRHSEPTSRATPQSPG